MSENKFLNEAKARVSTIRLRTWTLTIALVITLIFAFLVNITTKQAINPVDFLLMFTAQVLVHGIYFPDGELFGTKDATFINNKNTYNTKATDINQNWKFNALREYCKVEYEERKKRYFLNELGVIGITVPEFEIFKTKTPKEIKKLEKFEIQDSKGESKILIFSKFKRQRLYNLLFKPLPVQENHPETIVSAVENSGNMRIVDGSINYKRRAYLRKFLFAGAFGCFFAYVGYTVRTGVGFAEIVAITMYLTSIFATAVLAFTSGEICTRVHKSRFYMELANFIDEFNEWYRKRGADEKGNS